MRREILEFAKSKFPDLDTISALESLLVMVYATLDDVLFALEDAAQYPDPPFEEDEDLEAWGYWDYVY